MKKMAKTTIKMFFLLFLPLAASTALSQNNDNQGQNNNYQDGGNYQRGGWVRAPEIDPASAGGALAFLGGTLAIIRGYRRRQKK